MVQPVRLQHRAEPVKVYLFKLRNESYFCGGSPLVSLSCVSKSFQSSDAETP